MKTQKYLIVEVATIALLTTLCVNVYAALQEAYINRTHSFSIRPPSGWTVDESGSLGAVVIFYGPTEYGFRVNFNIVVESTSLTLSDYVTASKAQLPYYLSNFQLVSEGSRSIGGLSAYELVYTHTYSGFDLKAKQIYLVKDGKAYVLTFTTLEQNYGNYIGVFDESAQTFIIDKSPPTISIESPSDGSLVRSSSVTVSWSGSDTLSGVDFYEIKLDDYAWEEVGDSEQHVLSDVSEGTHTVYVRATDKIGNVDEDQVTFTVNTVTDTTPPSIALSNPADGADFSTSSVTFGVSASDTESGIEKVELYVDDQLAGTMNLATESTYTLTVSTLTQGTHTWYAKAYNGAGLTKITSMRNFGVQTGGVTNGNLKILVKDSQNNPIVGIQCILLVYDNEYGDWIDASYVFENIDDRTNTDSSGYAIFSDIPAGSYKASVGPYVFENGFGKEQYERKVVAVTVRAGQTTNETVNMQGVGPDYTPLYYIAGGIAVMIVGLVAIPLLIRRKRTRPYIAIETSQAPSTTPHPQTSTIKQCNGCGTTLPLDAVFCSKCGQKQEKTLYSTEIERYRDYLQKLEEKLKQGQVSKETYQKLRVEYENKMKKLEGR